MEVGLMAERDVQKDLDGVKEDLGDPSGALPLSGQCFEHAYGHPDHRHSDPAHIGRICVERNATQPLSPEDAKARLRTAATGGLALSWVRNYPKEGVLAAFILGFIIGTSSTASKALASGLVALLKRSRL